MKKVKQQELLFILGIGLFALLWAVVQPFNSSPDEKMRYEVAEYMYRYGRIPHGGDPQLRNVNWGISYAFSPVLSYMFSAVCMKITSLFADTKEALVIAARIPNVLFTAGTAAFTLQIGKRMLSEKGRWLFAALVTLLPGFLFLGSYTNTDAIAIFSTAWIFYSWVCYLKEGWSWKNCILLAAGMSVCFLSYYNAYGWILTSFLFFTATIFLCSREAIGKRFKFWLSRGSVIAAIVAVLAGWWFIRNGLIYDGDFLGRKTSALYGELYAREDLKPSVKATPQKLGWSLKDMFLYVEPGWGHNWVITVLVSFIGTFGYMKIFMPYWLSKIYFFYFVIGFFSMALALREFRWRERYQWKVNKREKGREISVQEEHKAVKTVWNKVGFFHTGLFLNLVIPVILLISYAYSSDLQAQGRYLMPALLPLMYFVTRGYEALLEKLVRNETGRRVFYGISIGFLLVSAIGTYAFVFLPNYI